ncbi:hypothetical protein [Methylobacterium sp. Leaf123]|nr:hypothetical protein [Methylobacterium sp. Leaf123]
MSVKLTTLIAQSRTNQPIRLSVPVLVARRMCAVAGTKAGSAVG